MERLKGSGQTGCGLMTLSLTKIQRMGGHTSQIAVGLRTARAAESVAAPGGFHGVPDEMNMCGSIGGPRHHACAERRPVWSPCTRSQERTPP